MNVAPKSVQCNARVDYMWLQVNLNMPGEYQKIT